jgi:protein AroM
VRRIGAITIGQAPRDDLVPEFRAALGREALVIERGALDDLTLDQVSALAPSEDDYVLVTRMRDGTEVRIAERHIIGRLQRCVDDLESRDVDLSVLMCTGEFPALASRRLLIPLDRLLESVVRGLLPATASGGAPAPVLAAVVPSAEQIPAIGRRWARACGCGARITVEAVSPYTAAEADYEAAAARVSACNPRLVVLDCVGFTESVRGIFRRATGKPVILPRSLLGRVAGELIA